MLKASPAHFFPRMNTTYDTKTIRLHWLSAALVLGLWVVGQCIDFFPRGTPRVTVRSLHICFGVLLMAVIALRLAWRRSGGVKLPAADPGLGGKLATGVHHLLYLLLVATVVAGAISVWLRGDNLFGLFSVPQFDPGNRALAHQGVEFHELCANLLLGLAVLHAAAAAWHQWWLKDGLMERMRSTRN